MNKPLPVVVLGGYLGAGKTTLVNQILRQANGLRIAVLVNEFGALPIDEDLIEARDDALISIAGGCICCSFGSDLSAALVQMTHLAPCPDLVLVEASGVAMPGAIAQTVELLGDLRVEGICVLVDGLAVRSQAQDDYIGDTITRQIDDAGIVCVTKTDLAAPHTVAATQAWLNQNWPSKPTRLTAQGQVTIDALRADLSPKWLPAKPAAHADAQFASAVLLPHGVCDIASVATALQNPELGIVRAKGYLDDVSGRRGLIQIAGGRCDVTFPQSTGAPGVVCIGLKQRFDASAIQSLADALPQDTK